MAAMIRFEPSHCGDCAENHHAIVTHLQAHRYGQHVPAQGAEGFRLNGYDCCSCGERTESIVAHHRHLAQVLLTLVTNYPPHSPEGTIS